MSSERHAASYTSHTTTQHTPGGGTQRTGAAYATRADADEAGARVSTTSQRLGEPAVQETRWWDAAGREVVGGRTVGGGRAQGRVVGVGDDEEGEGGRIEYLEDEGGEGEEGKREGGGG